jgi:hypothetical protein
VDHFVRFVFRCKDDEEVDVGKVDEHEVDNTGNGAEAVVEMTLFAGSDKTEAGVEDCVVDDKTTVGFDAGFGMIEGCVGRETVKMVYVYKRVWQRYVCV